MTDRESIYERDHGVCGFGGEHVAWGDLDIDHVVAKALGGLSRVANLRTSHAASNRSAGWVVRAQVRAALPPIKYRFIVTFPADLGDKVRELAKRERRPISVQIQLLVERALGYSPELAA